MSIGQLMPYEQPTGRQNIDNCSFKVKERFIIQKCSEKIKIKKCKNNNNIVTLQILPAGWSEHCSLFLTANYSDISVVREINQKSICSTACCSGNTLFLKIVPFASNTVKWLRPSAW